MTMEEALLYVRNAKELISMFGEEPFRKAIAKFNRDDFTTRHISPEPATHYRKRGYEVVRENFNHEFEEFKGEWSRKVTLPAVEFLVPNQYQLREKDLILEILHTEYPYTALFDLEVYHMDPPFLCYLKTDRGSLYIPYEAIVKGEWKMVEECHTTYHKQYYNTPERKEFLEKAMSALDTWQAKMFKAGLELCK